MTFKELIKLIFYSYFIILGMTIFFVSSAVQILDLGAAGAAGSIPIRDLLNMSALAIFTASTQFVLYSRKTLSNRQTLFRYIIIFVMVQTIVLLNANYMRWFNIDINNSLIILMIVVSTTIVFMVVLTISLKRTEAVKKAMFTAKEREFYFSQCQLMQESVEQIKSIRHDMKLHLATVKDYTANNKTIEATEYLGSLLGDIGETEVYSDTGNIAFDSIINFKLKNAVEDNVKLDIKVFVPPVLNIEVADVVTILGNLLDNALDAVAKVGDKRIKLNIESIKGNLFIMIENTFDGEIKYRPGKDESEKVIITRKKICEHGHGLNNVRKSASKYDGQMNINHEGNVFSVGILLYV